jgi:hypothetical protein
MDIFEASVGQNLFLFLDDKLVATLDGDICADETADLFFNVRENLERIFGKKATLINCGHLLNQKKPWHIKQVKRAVMGHLEEVSWTNEDQRYWFAQGFSKRGLALYECIFIRYKHHGDGTKTPIYQYHVTIINDVDCKNEAIEIATRRLNGNTIIENHNETIDFSSISIMY